MIEVRIRTENDVTGTAAKLGEITVAQLPALSAKIREEGVYVMSGGEGGLYKEHEGQFVVSMGEAYYEIILLGKPE